MQVSYQLYVQSCGTLQHCAQYSWKYSTSGLLCRYCCPPLLSLPLALPLSVAAVHAAAWCHT